MVVRMPDFITRRRFMRSEDGKHFENVVGIVDRDRETGEEFEGNVFDCNKPMTVGDSVVVNGKAFQYHGEDSFGCSIFTGPRQTIAQVRFGSNVFGPHIFAGPGPDARRGSK
jgi:hypothetical protein